MPVSTPPTLAIGDTLPAASWNTYVRDNIIDLAARLLKVQFVQNITDLTTTSVTFVDVTGITTNLTITRQSTIVMYVSANIMESAFGHAVIAKGVIDGVSDSAEVSSGLQTYYVPLGYVYAVTGKAAGTYTVKLQFRSTNVASTAHIANTSMFVVGIPEV